MSLDLAAAGRLLLFAGVSLAVGAAVYRAAVLTRVATTLGAAFVSRSAARAASLGLFGASVLAAAATLLLAAQLAALVGSDDGGPTLATVGASAPLLAGTTWGRAWLALAATTVVASAAFARARRGGAAAWGAAALAALALAAVPAFMGHAAADERVGPLAIVADAVHVLGGGAWLGTLAVLLVAGVVPALTPSSLTPGADTPAVDPTSVVATLVRAFSPVALAAAAAVVASGAFAAWLRLTQGGIPLAEAVGRTAYGRLLLAKLAAVAVTAALGAHNWRRLTPRLTPGADRAAPAALRRSAAREIAAALAVLAVTAVLVATPPPGAE